MLLPRFCTIRVSTIDPTSEDDDELDGTALCISWFGRTLEIQYAAPPRRHRSKP